MNERPDPVMKLAHHQPSRALPSGWSVVRMGDEIVLSGPPGSLTLEGKDLRASFSARLLYALLDDILRVQGE